MLLKYVVWIIVFSLIFCRAGLPFLPSWWQICCVERSGTRGLYSATLTFMDLDARGVPAAYRLSRPFALPLKCQSVNGQRWAFQADLRSAALSRSNM